ncbi:MAG: M15 family peptidase [Planctomycetaceae bacterium]|nr:MAG: M15 family peptidase [Planctomycetaceae bacterium]
MPTFSLTSKKRLESCHPDLQALFFYIILGYDCTIICGHRDRLEQEQAFVSGHSKLNWPDSKHNQYPSMAVDAAPYEKSGIDWGKLQSAHFAGYVKGTADILYRMSIIAHKVRCGLDWDQDNDIDDTRFWDACHFELIEP